MSREEGIKRIYKVLGKDLTEKVKQELMKIIEDIKELPEEVIMKLEILNKGSKEIEYFRCNECDGLKNFVKEWEIINARSLDLTELSDDDHIFDCCYQGFDYYCNKCEGTGIVDWIDNITG